MSSDLKKLLKYFNAMVIVVFLRIPLLPSATVFPNNLALLLEDQGHSDGTSSVAFEVLIINCQIYFISLFIFNCLALNINFFMFNLFDVKFLFSENQIFRKQKRTAVYGRVSLVSDFKLTRENDDLLSLRQK